MAIFGKTEIDAKILPYIQRSEGVGVIKFDKSKYSVRLENNELLLESYDNPGSTFSIDLNQIAYLAFDKGNFINEAKIIIRTRSREYVFEGVDDNDVELSNFHDTILSIKQSQVKPKRNGMPRPTHGITNPNKRPHSPYTTLSNHSNPMENHPSSRPHIPPTAPLDIPQQTPHNIPKEVPPQNNEMETKRADTESISDTNLLDDIPDNQIQPLTVPAGTVDVVDEIKRFYELKESGIITEEEFIAVKKKLLGL